MSRYFSTHHVQWKCTDNCRTIVL